MKNVIFRQVIYRKITFGSVCKVGFVLLEEISGPIRVSIWIEDLIESRVTLVAVEKLDKLFYSDVRLRTKPI